MSVVNRIVSAGLASWTRIVVTVASQIVAVPIYLRYWDIETYGLWLLIQSLIGFVTVTDIAHQNFVGFEFLKIGRQNHSELASVFCSALPLSILASLIPFAGLCFLVMTNVLNEWIGISAELAHAFGLALLVTAGTWVVTGSAGGVIIRVLHPFGHYPLMAWCGALFAVISAVVPVAAVASGADLLEASIAMSVSNVIYNIAVMAILIPMAKREHLFSGSVSLSKGLRRFATSLVLAVQSGLEIVRQHGSRLVLLPLAGMAEMTSFSTMRTGANFALQGLNTVTGPVMPEMMRFLLARDQHRTESAFAVVWLVLCAVLSPAVLVVQFFAPALFPLWTHGKIIFDPTLFAMLSLGVLVVALSQPAAAVAQGNNLLRSQLAISLLAAILAVAGMFVLVPLAGIRGAALALLLAELASLLAYLYVAFLWLRAIGMYWPIPAFGAATVSVMVAGGGAFALAAFPGFGIEILGLALVLEALVTLAYWRRLPPIARDRAAALVVRFVPGPWRGKVSNALTGAR
ncbi:MAG: lipopolysaccharide biosynthesis protein [Panacagrimonas sp.]